MILKMKTVKRKEWTGEVVLKKKRILKALIEKLYYMRTEKKLQNCYDFSNFFFNKYKMYFSIEDYIKLFYLQNEESFFHRRLVQHMYRTIHDFYISSILDSKQKKENIITHIYNCNLYKNKLFFIKNYFNFIQNMLLMCSLDLCMDNFFQIIHEKYKLLKLKNISQFYKKQKHNLIFTNIHTFSEVHLLIKLLQCFSSNHVRPFDFLNVLFYHCFYTSFLAISSRANIKNTAINNNNHVFRGEAIQMQKENSSINFPHFKEIISVLLYFVKLEFFSMYEALLEKHFCIIFNHLLYLIKKSYSHNVTHYYVNVNRSDGDERIEKIIDDLVMGFLIYLSSTFLHGDIATKIPSILSCMILSFHVLRYLHYRYIHMNKQPLLTDSFVLLNRHDTYLSNMSFSKKCLLLIYSLKELFTTKVNSYLSISIENSFQENQNMKVKQNVSNLGENVKKHKNDAKIKVINSYMKQIPTIDKTRRAYIISILDNTLSKNDTDFLSKMVSLELLKQLHYKLYLYPMYTQNQKCVNKKSSLLEKDVCCVVENVLQQKRNTNSYSILKNSEHIFFNVDILINRKTEKR